MDPSKTAIIVKIVKRCPILHHPKIKSGMFKTKYITDVDKVNGMNRSDTD